MPEKVVILGSTGSLGKKIIAFIRENRGAYRCVGLSCGKDIESLEAQIEEFGPDFVLVWDSSAAERLRSRLGSKTPAIHSPEDDRLFEETGSDIDILAVATSGIQSLSPTIALFKKSRKALFANKEMIASAGWLFREIAEKDKIAMIPLDSENSAIFRILECSCGLRVNRLVLTCSGGPFREIPPELLKDVPSSQALNHPVWRMGRKVSMDSATLLNKAFEIIEASALFDIPPEKIEVVYHPESVIHAIVEFEDNMALAALNPPDMAIPVEWGMPYPRAGRSRRPFLDFNSLAGLTLRGMDQYGKDVANLGRIALGKGRSACAAFNAADEVCVEAFLDGKIPFLRIVEICSEILDEHIPVDVVSAEDVVNVDLLAREAVELKIGRMRSLSEK